MCRFQIVDIKMSTVFYFNVNGQFAARTGSARGHRNAALSAGGNSYRGQRALHPYRVLCTAVVLGDAVCWNGGVTAIKNMPTCPKTTTYTSTRRKKNKTFQKCFFPWYTYIY